MILTDDPAMIPDRGQPHPCLLENGNQALHVVDFRQAERPLPVVASDNVEHGIIAAGGR
jgi:hypothetical protein